MADAGFVPAGFNFARDKELPDLGWGITNLVSRKSSGVADLGPRDFEAGRKVLASKIKKHRPQLVAMVGLMVFRKFFQHPGPLVCGLQPKKIYSIPCFVLPNPSGRNAHFTYTDMLEIFIQLRKLAR